MFVPLLVAGAAGLAYWQVKKRNKKMSPTQRKIYDAAMKSPTPPDKLRTLADAFEKEGFHKEANNLRKRAVMQEVPPQVKASRKSIFQKAMASKNIPAILSTATEFENQGYTANAAALKKRAAALSKTS